MRRLLVGLALVGALAIGSLVEAYSASQAAAAANQHAAAVEHQLSAMQDAYSRLSALQVDEQATRDQLRLLFAAIAQQEGKTPAALQIRLHAFCALVKC